MILYLKVFLVDSLEILEMLYVYLSWNLVEVTLNSMLLDFLPIMLAISLNRFLTKLEWSFYSSVFFHAVSVCSIIKLNLLVVSLLIYFM